MEQLALAWEPKRRTYTVSELTDRVRGLLEDSFEDIFVAGEISGCRTVPSGHCYFTLKDERCQIRCACFRSTLRTLRVKPQDGIAVIVRGTVTVYPERGEYQLSVESLEPQGHGALQFAFEQLKKKLSAEGLFESSRKRPLPRLPARIGLVTSPAGAVIRDMLHVLERRFPGLHLRLYPVQVQGEGAVEAVCRALRYFSESSWPQVIIIARGGGSLEDLWTFNEEAVARAIAACTVPVISAVGHETDFTIADFVADLRAPTPSAAAEQVICTRQELLERIEISRHKLTQSMRYGIAIASRRLHQVGAERMTTVLHRSRGRRAQRVDELDYRIRERVRRSVAGRQRVLDELQSRLRRQDLRLRFARMRQRLQAANAAMLQILRLRLAQRRGKLDPLTAHLTQLSPQRILDRGYAIVSNEAGAIVKRPADAPPGTTITARVAAGVLHAAVLDESEET